MLIVSVFLNILLIFLINNNDYILLSVIEEHNFESVTLAVLTSLDWHVACLCLHAYLTGQMRIVVWYNSNAALISREVTLKSRTDHSVRRQHVHDCFMHWKHSRVFVLCMLC